MKITLSEATALLAAGRVIGVPTDTVYGLAASVTSEQALSELYAVKLRPAGKPLVVQGANISQLKVLLNDPPVAFEKLQTFWPGPLTVVLPANIQIVPEMVRAGGLTVALRIANHPLLLDLLLQTGPLAIPSANLSDNHPAANASEVERIFGNTFPVLDGGPCAHGQPSTIVRLTGDGWELLREGVITRQQIEQALK